jgi:hypothetical protein
MLSRIFEYAIASMHAVAYLCVCYCVYVCVLPSCAIVNVCMHACMCVCMYVALSCMRVCVYACMYALSRKCVCMYACCTFVERAIKHMVG